MKLEVDQRTMRFVAKILLEMGAVKINLDHPFTWSAGWKSPIYCDNRELLSQPRRRTEIARYFRLAIESIGTPDRLIYGIAGVLSAGVPWASIVAHDMMLPLAYIRPEPKQHGTGKQVEGGIDPDLSYGLIDDLFSTGKSTINATLAARKEGMLIGVAGSIVTYGFSKADDAFNDAGIDHFSLTDYQTIIEMCNYFTPEQKDVLAYWSSDPSSWSVNHGGKP
jgi:orotate phosphoribosyltransferase